MADASVSVLALLCSCCLSDFDRCASTGSPDSQSVKADAVVGTDSRGFDGGKLINKGRKRHVVVDTLGLLLGVMVTAADTGDRIAAQELLGQVSDVHHRLELVWADGGYTGSLIAHCLTTLALVQAIVKRSDDMHGFVALPKRWIVERFFAHLMRTRRLVRDFERRTRPAQTQRSRPERQQLLTRTFRGRFGALRDDGWMDTELFPRSRTEVAPGAVHMPDWLDADRQREHLEACRDWARPPERQTEHHLARQRLQRSGRPDQQTSSRPDHGRLPS